MKSSEDSETLANSIASTEQKAVAKINEVKNLNIKITELESGHQNTIAKLLAQVAESERKYAAKIVETSNMQ
jgi:hypothetical protein